MRLLLSVPLAEVQGLEEARVVSVGQPLEEALGVDTRLAVPGRVALVQAVGERLLVGEPELPALAEAHWLAEVQ